MEKQIEKQLNTVVEDGVKEIFKIFKYFFVGIKKLRKKETAIAFVVTVCISGVYAKAGSPVFVAAALNVPTWVMVVLRYVILFLPIIYLMVLGGLEEQRQEKYRQIFLDIGFKEKNGKFPKFLSKKESDKKIFYIFRSNLSLKAWQTAKPQLEAGLDCNILTIQNKKSKKIIELQTISSDYELPEKIYWDDKYIQDKDGVICIGKSIFGDVCFDLNRTPHVLAAGETGSGKSVILRTSLWQLINQGARAYMIDFKGGVEFGKQYEQYGEVIVDRKRALEVLTMLCKENEKRLLLFRELEVKNLMEYNQKTKKNLCRIVILIDELAEMLDKTGVSKEDKVIYEKIEASLSTLARLSRATGINILIGVQRPDAKVLTGQIKNNVPVRISGRFADKTASEIVLGSTDATNLPDIKGRFLFKLGNTTTEFQAYYFDDETMLQDLDVEVGDMLLEEKDGAKKQKRSFNAIYDDKKYLENMSQEPLVKEVNPDESLNLDFDINWSADNGMEG